MIEEAEFQTFLQRQTDLSRRRTNLLREADEEADLPRRLKMI